ncbi:DNA-binding transcriptional MocR family regulator [Bradyrhizobium sp. F1.13.3]
MGSRHPVEAFGQSTARELVARVRSRGIEITATGNHSYGKDEVPNGIRFGTSTVRDRRVFERELDSIARTNMPNTTARMRGPV